MDKNDVIHTYTHTMEYCSVIKNQTMPLVATWMSLEIIILSEAVRKIDKYHAIALLCEI